MGYTHYWKGEIKDWRSASMNIARILHASHVPLGDREGNGVPDINEESISFNGRGAGAYETCCISRSQEFTFCKTARRAYDTAVTAVLLIAAHYGEDSFKLTSDGDGEDWDAGLALGKRAIPGLKIPQSIPRRRKQ